MNRKGRFFIKDIYMGSDGSDFKNDFIYYLKSILETHEFTAMSDHQLFLEGGKTAIQEIIAELE